MQSNALITFILLSFSALAGGADTGVDAFRRGDFDAAQRYFTAKAERGDRIAQNNLGVMYLKGRGVEVDFDKARAYFKAAANQTLGGAMFNLGIMHLRGYGSKINLREAVTWFRKSAA